MKLSIYVNEYIPNIICVNTALLLLLKFNLITQGEQR